MESDNDPAFYQIIQLEKREQSPTTHCSSPRPKARRGEH